MVLWDVACLQIKIKADHIFLWMWLRGSNVILKKDDSWREKEEKKKKKSSVVQVVRWCWWTFIHFATLMWWIVTVLMKIITESEFKKTIKKHLKHVCQTKWLYTLYVCLYFGLTSTWQQDNFICKADARLESCFRAHGCVSLKEEEEEVVVWLEVKWWLLFLAYDVCSNFI